MINSMRDECFLHAIVAALYKKDKKATRYVQYKRFIRKLKHDFLTYSVAYNGYDKVVYPLYASPKQGVHVSRQIDLLIVPP